jgi:hypothetical protein
MTDLSTLGELSTAEAWEDIPTGGRIKLAGFASVPQWRKFKELEKAQLIRLATTADEASIMALSAAMDKVVDAIAEVAVLDWEGVTVGDKKAEVTADNAKMLCGAKGPCRMLMLNAIDKSEKAFLSGGKS